ncbi:unnamed protein product, partial [Commensalibacter communis]
LSPFGMVKFRMTSLDVPTFSTMTFVPGSPVVIVPTVMDAG